MKESLKEWAENLIPWERDWFLFLNGSDSIFLDNIMWTLSGRWVWIPLYLFVLFVFFYKTQKKEAILMTVFLIAIFALCDQFSSGFMKPFFERFRPSRHPDFEEIVTIVNGYTGGRFGFISGHATNAFGFAVFLSMVFRYRWVTIVTLIWALLQGYTRIYLGVHFITDVIGGVIAGTLIAFILYGILIVVRQKLFHKTYRERTHLYSEQHGKIFSAGMAGYLIFVIIFAQILKTLPY
ncbi:MAG: phosphatase PAP2 family protein [Dysgonamonadaceae bacterium]|jgi:undecaprenyl-diphosphatase|nr:phosphatase PAP2 family protein [Dysgonamonadaceae bacterium]